MSPIEGERVEPAREGGDRERERGGEREGGRERGGKEGERERGREREREGERERAADVSHLLPQALGWSSEH